ncbi:MAG: GIY-YIG nuclease family protein [bacterium]|nr:GIY-YIG nuclease family protein [bacterium]
MNNTGIIYRAINLINGKSYIGQTAQKLEYRIKDHYRNTIRSNHKFANALKKYTPEDWKWEILVENVPGEQLGLFERSYIYGLSTFEFGYNSTKGGEENPSVNNPEVRRKISEANKGNKYCLGFKHTDQTRKNMSAAKKGVKKKPFTEQHRKNLSLSKKGICFSEEQKKAISESQKGRKVSQQTKNKMSESGSENWRIVKPDSSIEIIKNLKKYCRENNLNSSHMSSVANGKRKQHKGYRVEKLNG